MQAKTKQDVIDLRHKIMNEATTKSKVRRGDKRISSPSRVCSVCNQPLSGLNYTTGKALAKRNHWHLQFTKLVYIDICESAKTCCNNLGVKY